MSNCMSRSPAATAAIAAGAATLATLATLALATPALAAPSHLDGTCGFSGPIRPGAPITGTPSGAAHFSFAGSGTCDGHLDGAAITGRAVSVRFDNVQTAFDTCELGPDVDLPGTLVISGATFAITVDLARAAVAGPLRVTTAGGGLGVGSAMFEPPDPVAAPQQCAQGGLSEASLTASFTTTQALVGTRPDPAHPPAAGTTPAAPTPRARRHPAPRHPAHPRRRHRRHRRHPPRPHARHHAGPPRDPR